MNQDINPSNIESAVKQKPTYIPGIIILVIDVIYTAWWMTSIKSMWGQKFIIKRGNMFMGEYMYISDGMYGVIVAISIILAGIGILLIMKTKANAYKSCPQCGEKVLIDAKICRYCKTTFENNANN